MRPALFAAILLAVSPLGHAASGEAIYQQSCARCHDTGAMNTPRLGDQAAWKPLAEKGIDTLLTSVKTGKGAMPPRATCLTCSDEDYRAAIQYLIDAAR